jgi:hypothetical protein
MMKSKSIARTHRTDMIRVPLLPAAASTRKSGVKRMTIALNERHLATHAQPRRSTSHGIVRTAMTQTAKSPETERIAIQSTTIFQRGLSGRFLALRNLNHTKKARKGGETSDRSAKRLNMGLMTEVLASCATQANQIYRVAAEGNNPRLGHVKAAVGVDGLAGDVGALG